MSAENESENEPVNAVATISTSEPNPLSLAIIWLQRAMIGLLLVGHLLLPLCANGDLLRDAAFCAQLGLFTSVVFLGGLSWRTAVPFLLVGLLVGAIWIRVFPAEYIRDYVVPALLVPQILAVVCLLLAALFWVQGTWNAVETRDLGPLQVSIRGLLIATTLIAITLAGANWLQTIASFYDGSPTYYVLVCLVDGFGSALLSLAAVWAIGTRGATVVKSLILLLLTAFLALVQIIAFGMADFWQYVAVYWGWYALLTFGSLWTMRLAGWQLIPSDRTLLSRLRGSSWSAS
ncbi:hypothetical protein ETAA8_58520 [Anatilimnocola aggregata]|uniref:Uncharacterized protein n=1 Tax=Anatilimnocola aggregata TaxID=2528021 RepID=A0A517YKE8_9BACT|nr:hypothetical protein [Anatilimnocola aggregata]QDU30704.1 hypothetical protein ETAA8_58520 [Anatilimnocola aggregata]